MNRLGRWRAPLSLYSSAMLLFGGVTSEQVSQAALGSVCDSISIPASPAVSIESIAIVPYSAEKLRYCVMRAGSQNPRRHSSTQAALLRGE